MTPAIRHRLTRDRKASTVPETAIVLALLIPMLLAGIDLGLMMWTKGTLQSVAAMTARCAALGSTSCANPQAYAVSLANSWLGSALIANANVTVNSTATTCQNATGSFEVITITASIWTGSIVYPVALNGRTQTLTACYPH